MNHRRKKYLERGYIELIGPNTKQSYYKFKMTPLKERRRTVASVFLLLMITNKQTIKKQLEEGRLGGSVG